MDYRIIGYVALGVLALFIVRRLTIRWLINKFIRAEMNHVLNHPDFKVKGRFE